jgi:AAHS family 4-hydroxybenzoate transporter-like MFS transporter
MTGDATSAVVDVGDLLDHGHWRAYQKRLVFVAALAVVFDGMDNQMLGVTLPAILREWSMPKSAFSPVVSFGYLGMVIGGVVGGMAGDRVGRRAALILNMLAFGTMTAATSAAHGILAFAAFRCLAGFGLGGAIPNAAALVAEYAPLPDRTLAITITVVCTPVGAMLAGLIAIPVLPAAGWRMMFLMGGLLPIVLALALRRLLPESPRFLTRRPERRSEAVAALRRMGYEVGDEATFVDRSDERHAPASILALFTRELRLDTAALWAAFLSSLLTVYMSLSWVPSMLADAGYQSSTASAGITAFNLGGIVGAVAGGVYVTRWGSRRPMPITAALAAVSAAVLSQMHLGGGADPWAVLAMLAITGALINSVQSTMFALAAHIYPAAIRATGVGSAAAFGRVGAILSGYVGVWALEYRGSTSFFGLIAVSLLICCAALALVRRHVPASRAL